MGQQSIKQSNPANTQLFAGMILCIIVGAIMRFAYCIRFPVQPRDAYFYKDIISTWESSGTMGELNFYPLSLWFLRIPHSVFGYDIFKGAIIVNVLLGILFIICSMHLLSKLVKNNYAIILTGLALATHPQLIYYSCSLLRENTYLIFSLLLISSLIQYTRNFHIVSLLAASFFGAVSFLCRLEGLEIILIFNIALVFLLIYKKIHLLKAFCHSLLFFAFFVLSSSIICYCMNFPIVKFGDIMARFIFKESNLL